MEKFDDACLRLDTISQRDGHWEDKTVLCALCMRASERWRAVTSEFSLKLHFSTNTSFLPVWGLVTDGTKPIARMSSPSLSEWFKRPCHSRRCVYIANYRRERLTAPRRGRVNLFARARRLSPAAIIHVLLATSSTHCLPPTVVKTVNDQRGACVHCERISAHKRSIFYRLTLRDAIIG